MASWQKVWDHTSLSSEGSADFKVYAAGNYVYGIKNVLGNGGAKTVSYLRSSDNGATFTEIDDPIIGLDGCDYLLYAEQMNTQCLVFGV